MNQRESLVRAWPGLSRSREAEAAMADAPRASEAADPAGLSTRLASPSGLPQTLPQEGDASGSVTESLAGVETPAAVVLPADPLPVTRTLVTFSGSASAFGTTGGTVMEYEILGFEQSFSQHFTEGTFGVNIPLVYLGFDLSATVDVGLVQRVEFGASNLNIQYQVLVDDLRAPGGRAVSVDGVVMPFFDNVPVTWDTNFSFVGADMNVLASTATRAALDLDYSASVAINNFQVGIDLWIDEFGVGPWTLFNESIAGRFSIFESTGGRDTASDGAFEGWMDRPTLAGASGGAVGSGDLPSISLDRSSTPFARLQFDIAKFIGNLLGVELSGEISIVDGLTFEYTILKVLVGADLRVGQTITFDPMGIGVDIRTSVGQNINGDGDGFIGEHLVGQLGDTFTLATPDMGAGVIDVAVNYTLQGTLRSEGQFIATAGINIQALGAELHNTILKDFHIGVGPLINIEVPAGGIPLGSASADDRSIQVSLSAPEQTFQFYWERPVFGTDGDDTFGLNPQTNAPGGTDPNYLTRGFGGDDAITGNGYNNPIRGDGGDDLIHGGAGLDYLRGDSGNDEIHGGDDTDTIFGEAGDDVIYGDAGNDFITGGSLIGGSGSDRLYGGAGNDTLNSVGVDGADVLDGGDGNDRAVIGRRSSFSREVFDMTAPKLVDAGGSYWLLADGTKLYSIERVAFNAGLSDDVIVTKGGGHFIYGGGGNDELRAEWTSTVLLNDVYFDGESGDDTIHVGWGDGGTFLGGSGSDRLVLTASSPIIVNFTRVAAGEETLPNLVVGGFEHFTITAGNGADFIVGSNGDDVLDGGGGADILYSGLGADKLYGGAGDDRLISDTYLLGTSYVLVNGVLRRTGPIEADLLDGGDGVDIARIDRSTRSNATTFTFVSGAASTLNDGTTLINIERIEFLGGGGDDTVRGGDLTDTLNGGGGRDQLDGGGGQDIINAGDGDDRVIGRRGELAGDVLNGDGGLDTLQLDFSDRVFGITANLGLMNGLEIAGLVYASGFDRFDITGTQAADVLTGGDAAAEGDGFGDRFEGGDGNDVLDGRGGRDFLSGGRGSDTLVWSAGGDLIDGGGDDFTHDANGDPVRIAAYIDTLQIAFAAGDATSASVVLWDPTIESTILGATVINVERLDVTGGAGALFVQGGVAGDRIIGSTVDDQLYGVGGDDVIDGRAGVDLIRGGAGNDTITDQSGAGQYYGDAGDDLISAANGASTIDGGDGADTLTSGYGVTTMTGGLGDDRLVKNLAVSQMGSQGAGIDNLSGGDGNDTIVTGYRAVISGGAGYDVLTLTGHVATMTVDITGAGTTATADGGSISGIERLIFTGGAGNETVIVKNDFGLLDGGTGTDRLTMDFRQIAPTPVFATTDAAGRTTIGTLGGAFQGFEFVTIYLGDGADNTVMRTLASAPTNFTVHGGGGDDRLGGGSGSDVFYGGAGVDTLVLRGTKSQYTVSSRPDGGYTIVDNTANRDGSDIIYGVEYLAFSDTTVTPNTGVIINGTSGNDTIMPGVTVAGQPSVTAVDDILRGYGGNDTLSGGAGVDQMYGGTGDDRYIVDANDVVVEYAGEGNDRVESDFDYELGANIEDLALTGTGNVRAVGNGLVNRLYGNSGANLLDGRGGADLMYGGAGADTYYVDNAGDLTIEQVNEGEDTVVVVGLLSTWTLRADTERLMFDGPIGPVTGIGNALANVITGGFANDTLYGMAGNDTLNGGDGDDRLDGGIGADVMYGGAGNDTYFIDASGDLVSDSSGSLDRAIVSASYWLLDSYMAIEEIELAAVGGLNIQASANSYVRRITGNALGNDLTAGNSGTRVEGMGGDDFLYGGFGADILDGGTGIDRMAGGLGDDTYMVDAAGDMVNESANQGFDTVVVANLSAYTLVALNIERVEMGWFSQTLTAAVGTNLQLIGNADHNTITGSSGHDVIEGWVGADQLIGNAGDDTLIGGEGDDRLTGGAGADYLDGGVGDDVAIYQGARASFTITLTGSGYTVSSAAWGVDTLLNIETLRFDDGDVSLTTQRQEGGPGPDTLTGGAGNDILVGADGSDVLRGLTGDDRLEGGEGNDLLEGGEGDDVLIGGVGSNTATYENAASAVSVVISTIQQNTIGAGRDTLFGIQNLLGSAFNDTLSGDAGNNTLTGGAGADNLRGGAGFDLLRGGEGDDQLAGGLGADILDGGAGVDRMVGGDGDDTYHVNEVGDVVIERAGEGTDLVISSISLRLGADVENLRLLGESAIDGRGNAGDNFIEGNAGVNLLDGLGGDDRLSGGFGDDRLLGGQGDDVLIGGAGLDRLVGGAGADTFVFMAGDTSDVRNQADRIDDFVRGLDRIDLSAMDARESTAQDDAFTMIGSAAFSRTEGELRYLVVNSSLYVQGDTNGDGRADFMILVSNLTTLSAADFLL